jgi:hypothetical protein
VPKQNFIFLDLIPFLTDASNIEANTREMGENPGTCPIILRPQRTASQGMATTVGVARDNGENGAVRSVTYRTMQLALQNLWHQS